MFYEFTWDRSRVADLALRSEGLCTEALLRTRHCKWWERLLSDPSALLEKAFARRASLLRMDVAC